MRIGHGWPAGKGRNRCASITLQHLGLNGLLNRTRARYMSRIMPSD